MPQAIIEHVNLTVSDPAATAEMLNRVFGWNIRWQGAAMDGGHTVHVGGNRTYLALYAPRHAKPSNAGDHRMVGTLNHVGIMVDDLDAAEKRVKEAGFNPHSHADYEPGRRFYFDDGDGIEYEVVSYA